MKTIDDLITPNKTKSRYLQLLSLIAELRYVDFPVLKSVTNTLIRVIATRPVLDSLLQAEYLGITDNNAYYITGKALEYLKKEGVSTRHFIKRLRGSYDSHQEAVTRVLLPQMFESDYYAVIYPTFKKPPNYEEVFLIPDYCLIRKNDGAYKIEFGEVEVSPKQDSYIEDKKKKYEQIAQDGNTYFKWWKSNSKILGLPMCSIDKFCFSVICYGNEKHDWEGWTWKKTKEI